MADSDSANSANSALSPPELLSEKSNDNQTLIDDLSKIFQNKAIVDKLATALEQEGLESFANLKGCDKDDVALIVSTLTKTGQFPPLIVKRLSVALMEQLPKPTYAGTLARVGGGSARPPVMRPVASTAAPESGTPGEPHHMDGLMPWRLFKEATKSKAGNPLKLPHTVAARASGWVSGLCRVANLTHQVSPVTRDGGVDTYVQKMSADESVLAIIKEQMSSVPGDYDEWVALGQLIAK
jgi:hypothetical protein